MKTTVKDIKQGSKVSGQIVYIAKPYVVISDEGIVLHAGTLESIKALVSYYDGCKVENRENDLYLNDNTKISALDMTVCADA